MQIVLGEKCSFFKALSKCVWHKIIESHSVEIDVPEIGTTSQLVTRIRIFAKQQRQIEVWANHSYKESKHGNDIDLFVEVEDGRFIWYALQAKVLKQNNKYEGLKAKGADKPQWEKLSHLASESGCVSKYLFYNGLLEFEYNGIDRCSQHFNQELFGCSIVDIEDVRRVASSNLIVRFEDFHPHLAEPWHVLVCCNNEKEAHLYTLAQIKRAVQYYPFDRGFIDVDGVNSKSIRENRNAINIYSENIERIPQYRIVVQKRHQSFLDRLQ
jgi:hypothetical protein